MEKPALTLALKTISIGKQALIFANTKRSAEKMAEDLAKSIKIDKGEWIQLSEKIEKVLSRPTKQCKRLAFCVKKGVAFHHAGLNYKQKELIEQAFRDGIIKVISSTPTLALGVSLPAFGVIMNDLRRCGHRGLQWIPTLEYLQMAGRAGRPEWDDHGEAIAVANTQQAYDEIEERYIKGEPEEIYSKLAVEPVLRTYVLSLISSGFVRDRTSIMEFFAKTFWAFQYQDMTKLEQIVDKMLHLLEQWEFIMSSQSDEDFVSGDEIFNVRYRATLIGKRVAQLYIDPLTANFLIENSKRASLKKVNEISFLQIVSNTLEIRPKLRVRTKDYDKVQQVIMEEQEAILEEEPAPYDEDYEEFMNSMKTAMFFRDWINEKDEEFLLEEYSVRPGEIRVKLDRAEWLLYAASELMRMINNKEVLKEIMKIRLRLKHGVKEELLALLKLKGIGRVRARKMHNNGIKDIGYVKKSTVSKLVSLLGKKVAYSVKEQVGQKVKLDKTLL